MTATAETVAAWDPEALVGTAKELIHASNYEKVGEARANVDRALAQWVQEAAQVIGDAALRVRAEQAIVKAWALYAALEIELRQFKQATKVFESAVGCAVAGAHAALWLQYAAFCIDRKKFSNARKVFVRALRAVAERDHGELWAKFHAFVVEHLDPNMTLEALQAQVFPERNGAVAELPPPSQQEAVPSCGAAGSASQPVEKADVAIPSSGTVMSQNGIQKPPAAPVEKVQAPPTPAVDSSLAFVDKKGDDAAAVEALVAGKRKASDAASNSPAKQAKIEATSPPSGGTATGESVGSFLEIPTTLPITPGCPHLLFDQMETERPIDNELLDKLSHVLSDSAVFQGVRDLYDNQRQRDRDMLYRWQDLVGMQMKEGSELFARHMDAEKAATEPRDLIDLKAKHLEQRREFGNRCQMSQQQFIEICEMDRMNALKAQQISLENMKIPEMTVTTDPDTIELQRAIIGVILEAEKLSREESSKKAPDAHRPKKPYSTPKAGPHRPRSDSRDRDSYPRGGGRGGRGGFSRGGGSFGRGGGFRRQFADSPPRGGRGQPRRYDGYASQSSFGPRTYDNGPRQSQPAFQGNNHRNFSHGPTAGRGYGDRDRPAHFDRGQDRRQQSFNRGPPHEAAAPPLRFADAPPAQNAPSFGAQDQFRGANPHVGSQGGRGPPPTRHVEYDRGNRYGGPPQDTRTFSAPPANRYGGEPATAPARYGGEASVPLNRYGGESGAPSNRYGGAPTAPQPRYGGEPTGPTQQFSAPPSSYDYAPQAASAPYRYEHHPAPVQQQQPPPQVHYGQPPVAVYNQPAPTPVYQQQPPPQQHPQQVAYQHQPPPQQQQQPPPRGYGVQPPYHAPPHQQQQPQQHHHQPQHHRQPYHSSPPRGGGGGGRGGYDRFRRGGGGGGRYGRR